MIRKVMIVLLLLSFTTLIIIGCVKPSVIAVPTSSQKNTHKPVWVDRETARYPSEEYLTGVGSGATRELAENAALASISKVFDAKINGITESIQRSHSELSMGGHVKEAYKHQFSSSVSVATSKVLENIKIVERWLDDGQQVYHALAAMDRVHSSKIFSARIEEIDRDVQVLRQRAAGASDRIELMRTLNKKLKLLESRAIYNADLRIINADASSIAAPVSLADVQQQVQYYLSNEFRIGVDVSGKYNKQMHVAIIEALSKEGLSVEKNSQTSDLDMLVKANVSFENADLPKYKFVRWRIEFNLINPKTEKILGGFESAGKSGHKTFSEAEKRAVRTAKKRLVSDIGEKIISVIFLEI